MLFDKLFLEVARDVPLKSTYIEVLALRDCLVDWWMDRPRGHSKASVYTILTLSGFLGSLDIRFLGTGKNPFEELEGTWLGAWTMKLAPPSCAPLQPYTLTPPPSLVTFLSSQIQAFSGYYKQS